MIPRYGYCCINLSLASDGVSTNRGMVKKTFDAKGLQYVSELALQNVKDLGKIFQWNIQNGIRMYRMSSDIFPWCSEYEFSDLPDFKEILTLLSTYGSYAQENDLRLTFHPSPYGVLASQNPDVVSKAIKEITQHAEMMDFLGLPQDHSCPINVHVNSSKPDKESAAQRFCDNFPRLPISARSRLVLEVDDKKSQFTSIDLKTMIHNRIGIPLTFDFLHNKCNPPDLIGECDSLKICLDSWPSGITPITHYSDSRRIFEDSSSKENAHSDWIWQSPETYGFQFDIEFEVKKKDLAVLKYISEKETLYEKLNGDSGVRG